MMTLNMATLPAHTNASSGCRRNDGGSVVNETSLPNAKPRLFEASTVKL